MRILIVILWLLALVDLSAGETGWMRSTNTAANWTRTSYYTVEVSRADAKLLSEKSPVRQRPTRPQRHVALPILLTLVLWYVALKRRGLIVMGMLLLVVNQASAAQTLLKRSMFMPTSFTNVCDITQTNLSGFDYCKFNFPVIGYGATTNGQTEPGWSGWVQKGSTNCARFTNLVANTYYQASCWFRLHQFATATTADAPSPDTSAFRSRMLTIGRDGSDATYQITLGVAGAGTLWCENVGGPTTNIAVLDINRWYYLAVAWRTTNSGGFKKDGQIYLGTLGSSPTNLYAFTGVNSTAAITWCDFGLLTGTSEYWSGRMTGCSIHTLADFSDVGIPTDINPPSNSRSTYYINPATGSDLNSGMFTTNAYASGYRVWQLLYFGGAKGGQVPWVYTVDDTTAVPGSNPWAWNRGVMDGSIHATGDKILIDTSSAPLRITNAFRWMTNNVGVELGSATAAQADIRPYRLLTGTWTQYDAVNFPNIWQIANSSGQSNIVVWEDLKWMNNPTNTSGLVNLTTNLNSTPGSFWTDTTNLYVHPFGSTNPNSDGKTYECGQWLYVKLGTTPALSKYSTVEMYDNGSYLNRLKIYGNTYRNQYTGVWDAMDTLRLANGGPAVIGECNIKYGGSHAYGGVEGPTNLYRFNFNNVVEQGTPWTDVTGASGYGNLVDFPSITPIFGRKTYWFGSNCATSSVIGSSSGVFNPLEAFFSHESGTNSYPAYADLHYVNCVGSIILGDNQVQSLVISNCISSFMFLANQTNGIITRTTINGALNGTSGGTMTDSVMNRQDNITQNFYISGPWTFTGCTFDVRNASVTGPNAGIIRSDNTTNLTATVSNCLILLPNDSQDTTFLYYKGTDTLTFNNNVYLLNAQGHCNSDAGAEKTWAQWQALGYDAASSTNNPAIGPGYRPYAKTPTWNVATDRGVSIDYTGKLFQSRRTAGAYEYDPPWMMLP